MVDVLLLAMGSSSNNDCENKGISVALNNGKNDFVELCRKSECHLQESQPILGACGRFLDSYYDDMPLKCHQARASQA